MLAPGHPHAGPTVGRPLDPTPGLSRASHDGAYFGGKSAGAQGAAQAFWPGNSTVAYGVLQQFPQSLLLLRTRQQPQRLQERLRVGIGANEGVGEGVERRHCRCHHASDPGCDLLPPVLRGPTPEGETQDLLGRHGIHPAEASHHRLDQGCGLAGARTGQHQQRPPAMGDDKQLLGIQRRRTARHRRGPIKHRSHSHSRTTPRTSDIGACAVRR